MTLRSTSRRFAGGLLHGAAAAALATALATATTTGTALGQTAGEGDDTVPLDPLVISGDVLPDATQPFFTLPSSTSVLTGEQVEAGGIRSVRDIALSLPNVTGFDAGGNRMTTFSIRGVHELGYQSSPGVYPGVSYYVDDVPALTTLARASLFSNIGQISVLRGPQNDYGFSRPGGVIEVRSAEPTDAFTGYLSGAVGNYDFLEGAAGFSSPLGAGFSLSVDLLGQGRDGFYDNTALDQPYGDKGSYGGRARLTWQASDSLLFDLLVQHERMDDETDPFIPLGQLDSNPYEVAYDDPGSEQIGQDLQALRVRASFDGFDLLSVTAHRYSTWDFANDGDGSAQPYDPGNPFSRLTGYTDEQVRTVTQEFRLNSLDDGGWLNWSGGVFAGYTDMDISTGYILYPDLALIDDAEAKNTDLAVFGELEAALTDEISLVPGLRYEWAGRKASNEFSAPYVDSGSGDFSAVLPSLSLVYSPVPTLMTYAKYTRGFRPGGFNAHKAVFEASGYEFESETSDNVEIGFKSRFLDDRLGIDGALFYSRFHDYQVLNQFSPTTFGVNNAQSVESYGGELEASFQIVSSVRLYSALGVTQAKYLDFENGYGDFSDNEVAFIPAFTANYGVQYEGDWGGFVTLDARTMGSYYLDEANYSKQGSVTIANAQIGYRWHGIELAFYAENIFDQEYVVNAYDFAGTGVGAYGMLGDPATFGFRTRIVF